MDTELSLTLSILRFHTGESNAISAKQLARDLGFSEKDTRQVRTTIRELRRLGEPVLASTDGYFLPNSYDEADRWYWKHQKELCKMPAEMTKLTQPVWDKDFDEES